MRITNILTLFLLLTMAFYGCNKESNAPKEINSDLPGINESNDKAEWIYINESDDMIEPKDLFSALDRDIAGYEREICPPELSYNYMRNGEGSTAGAAYYENDRLAFIMKAWDSEWWVNHIYNSLEFRIIDISNGNIYARYSSSEKNIAFSILIRNRIIIGVAGNPEMVPEAELERIIRTFDVVSVEMLVD